MRNRTIAFANRSDSLYALKKITSLVLRQSVLRLIELSVIKYTTVKTCRHRNELCGMFFLATVLKRAPERAASWR